MSRTALNPVERYTALVVSLLSLLLGVVLSLANGVVFGRSLAPYQGHTALVALQRTGPASDILWRYVPVHHTSGVVSGYVDRQYSTAWVVWFRYSGCSATSHGAFRLTVFSGQGNPPTHGSRAQLPPGAVRYSRTLVDRKGSDNATYIFLVQPARWYYYQVVVPSRQGCRSWQLGVQGN